MNILKVAVTLTPSSVPSPTQDQLQERFQDHLGGHKARSGWTVKPSQITLPFIPSSGPGKVLEGSQMVRRRGRERKRSYNSKGGG